MQNQQIIYQQQNSQIQPFQHYSPNGSLQGPSHFVDNRPQFNPNQFQSQVNPRIIGPRLDYGPRGAGLSGSLQGPSYNHPSNQSPYVQIQPGPTAVTAPFQNSAVLMQDNQTRLIQNNQGPLLQGNPGGTLLGNLSSVVPGTSAPLLQNQPLSLQGFPRQASSQGPLINHPNVNQIPNQSHFENRPSFQEAAQFENRPIYDSRTGYSDQVSTSQFNTNTLPVPQQSTSNVPNVPLPPGHKILINPHFRGAVQSTNDGKSFQITPSFRLYSSLISFVNILTLYFTISKQQDSLGILLSNKHLIYHPKFLLVSFHNPLSLIKIKVLILKLNKDRHIISKIINKIRAMYVFPDYR